MILALYIIFSLYFFCMVALVIGFRKLKVFSTEEFQPLTTFTLIIPFRNESENLPALLKSISNLKYPIELFKVIFVNDASEDNSEEIIRDAIKKSKISMELLQNNRTSNSPKKDAISKGIKHSKSEWILTTDADCELPERWLRTLDDFIQQKDPIMVCAPVIYKSNSSFLQTFQQLDGLSLQAATMGSFGLNKPILCNGANLGYRKNAFEQVDGFSGNDHIASGDDIFLMEKMKNSFPGRVKFLKSANAIVSTIPQMLWKDLINQRVRWASKTSKQKNLHSISLGGLVFLVNICFLFLPIAIIIDFQNYVIYGFLIILKILIDYIVVRQVAKFFEQDVSIFKFAILSVVYGTLIFLVVFRSICGEYSWKGRTFQNRI